MLGKKTGISLAVTGLGISYLLMGSAWAAPDQGAEVYFYPSKAWSAGLSQPTAGGEQSCAIQNEFNNGFVIRVDGSSRWVESMSINFRQNIFESGKTYDVNLDVPGGGGKTMKATAASGSILSIDMHGQKELYKAMRGSSVLDLAVEGNPFRFYLVGFDDAAQIFEKCMAGGAMDKNAQEASSKITDTDAAPADITVNESIAMEERESEAMTRRSADVDSVKADPALTETDDVALTGAAAPASEEVPLSETAITPVEAETTLDTSTAMEAQETIAAADMDADEMNAAQAEKIQAMKTPEPLSGGMDGVQAEAAPDAPPLAGGSSASTSEDTAEMESAPETTQEAPAQEPARRMPEPGRAKVTKEIAKAELDFTQYDDMEPAADDNGGDYGRRISELEAQLRALETENRDLNDELSSALAEGAKETAHISSENWNLESATMRFQEAERQIKKIGAQLQKERAQCSMEKKELEAMLFDPQVTNEQQLAKLADLEGQLAKAKQELADQRMMYEERLRIQQKQSTH